MPFVVAAWVSCVLCSQAAAQDAPKPAQPARQPVPPLPEIPVRAAPASGKEEVRASHILCATKEEADAVRKEVQAAGSDRKAFAAAARKHSKDPSTKILGGDVGYFGPSGQMDREFSDAAFRLKVGDVSEPVKSTFGWHLIYVADRRDRETKAATQPTVTPTPSPPPNPPPNPNPSSPLTKNPDPNALAPNPAQAPTPAPVAIPVTPPAPAAPPVEPKRAEKQTEGFRMTLETSRALGYSPKQFSFTPETAPEINVTLKSDGAKEQKFFARELWPLGFKVTPIGDAGPAPGDFTQLAEPANFFITLKMYEITGIELSLADYWKGLKPRRYNVGWDMNTFLTNLEARFPNVKQSPDYAPFGELLTQRQKRFPLQVTVLHKDLSPRLQNQRNRDLSISVFEPINNKKKYYAQIRLQGADQPLVIELNTEKQFQGANHFASLINEGFYDGLEFFDEESGDFLLGGCPTRTGTGAPAMNLPRIRNDQKLEHKRGTVSFVSRSVRARGPAKGGEVGSIFVVCLKPHLEWDMEHVPIGEVVAGLEVLEKPGSRAFREISVLTEEAYAAKKGEIATTAPVTGNPEALIKTPKGSIAVELLEDSARNTVANFITLATSGFYNKLAAGEGKQKFFLLMKDQAGKPLLIQGGSPTNTSDGHPGHAIRSEVNAKKHVKGALSMVVAYNDQTNSYVPDSAGSQFFICLQDIPYYDYQKAFTIFGQVKSGTDVLEKLEEGDAIESIEITKKKPQPYNVQKIASP